MRKRDDPLELSVSSGAGENIEEFVKAIDKKPQKKRKPEPKVDVAKINEEGLRSEMSQRVLTPSSRSANATP